MIDRVVDLMVACNDVAVEVDSLSHRYRDHLALDALSFSVRPASLFALLGPNGSGKTTLFRILATVLKPTSGLVRIMGTDIVQDRASVQRRIGIVFQRPSVDGRLTVSENLMHQGHLYGLYGAALRSRRSELLARFGLIDVNCGSGIHDDKG